MRHGRFAGLIDAERSRDEIKRAGPCTGKAGSMSFHPCSRRARLGDQHVEQAMQSAALRGRRQRH